jgi:hypothetical protein
MRRSLASLLLAACLAASPAAAAERLLVGNGDQAIALSRIVRPAARHRGARL